MFYMDEALFQTLQESIKEAGAILKGTQVAPKEQVHFVEEPDPRSTRKMLGINQAAFAALLGISVRTLQNWEQGRRSPQGPALKLLQVAQRFPEILLELAGSTTAAPTK